MRMRTHSSPPGARWLLLLTTSVYVLAVGAAPALHFADSGYGIGESTWSVGSGDGEERAPPTETHAPDQGDCLLCQVISSAAHPEPPELGSVAPPSSYLALPVPSAEPPPAVVSLAFAARAPPNI